MSELDIANLVLAITGIVVSGAGFWITLAQLRKTRSSLEAAETATRTAISGLSVRMTVSDLADMRSGLKGIQTAMRGARIETALIQTQAMVEQLHSLRTRAGFEDESRHTEIQEAVVQIAKLRNRLEQKIAQPDIPLSIFKANNMLSELGGKLSAWSEELRFVIDQEENENAS